ncbi:MAG: GntR family transcriptional regulator, partial [Pseudonocardiaceae bacterium]
MPLRDRVQAVDRSSPLPLWAQMQEDLRRRLTTGAFAERFPTELELVEQYAVSRHTVREALR